MTLMYYIKIASGLLATTYGHGELMCGDVNKPRACAYGATTSNGSMFDPSDVTAAVAASSVVRVPPSGVRVHVRIVVREPGHPFSAGPCKQILITDKMNERWVGVRGWDLTPGAVAYLGGVPSPLWSAKLELCRPEKWMRDKIWDNQPHVGRLP